MLLLNNVFFIRRKYSTVRVCYSMRNSAFGGHPLKVKLNNQNFNLFGIRGDEMPFVRKKKKKNCKGDSIF